MVRQTCTHTDMCTDTKTDTNTHTHTHKHSLTHKHIAIMHQASSSLNNADLSSQKVYGSAITDISRTANCFTQLKH